VRDQRSKRATSRLAWFMDGECSAAAGAAQDEAGPAPGQTPLSAQHRVGGRLSGGDFFQGHRGENAAMRVVRRNAVREFQNRAEPRALRQAKGLHVRESRAPAVQAADADDQDVDRLAQAAEIGEMERGKVCPMKDREHFPHQTWQAGRNVVRYVHRDSVRPDLTADAFTLRPLRERRLAGRFPPAGRFSRGFFSTFPWRKTLEKK